TDFTLLAEACVVEETNGSMTKAWVPMVVGKEAPSEPGRHAPVRVVVATSKPRNDADLVRFCAQTTRVQGLVMNDLRGLPGDVAGKFNELGAVVDRNNCLVIEEGRAPSSAGKIRGLMWGGVAMMVAGGGLIVACIVLGIRAKMAG